MCKSNEKLTILTYILRTAQKMKFSIKDFFSKCDQIRSFLRIWSHLLKKSSMENFIFCTVFVQLEILISETYTAEKNEFFHQGILQTANLVTFIEEILNAKLHF